MYQTSESDNNNFILHDQRQDDYVDFLSQQSLSENGYILHKRQIDAMPPPNSKDKNIYFLPPISPNNLQSQHRDNDNLIVKVQTPLSLQSVRSVKPKKLLPQPTNNFSGSIIRYFHIKRFTNRLRKTRYLFSKLGPKHLDILNDQASSYNPKIFGQKQFNFRPLGIIKQDSTEPTTWDKFSEYYNRQIANVSAKLDYWDSTIPLFYPESRCKIIWDTILCINRMYFILLIPMDIAFEEQFIYSPEMLIITIIMTMSIVADTLMNFNTAYYQFGQIVRERGRIFRHVVGKAYGLDMISVLYLIIMIFIDWEELGHKQPYVLMGLLTFFVHYENIMKLISQVEEVLNLNKIAASISELLKLLLLLIYVLHISTCIWYGVIYKVQQSAAEQDMPLMDTVGWIHMSQLIVIGQSSIYDHSISVLSPCTLLAMEIWHHPVYIYTNIANLEYGLTIIFIMIFSIQLPYSVNTVGAIIDKISQYSESKMQNFRIINTYMAKKKISYQLQFQIREYLNYYWEIQNKQDNSEEKTIVDQLSSNLREQLMIEANSMLLNGCDVFKTFFSEPLKRKLVKQIRQLVVQPENLVDCSLDTDSKDDTYLIFIEQGDLEILIPIQNTVVGTVTAGGYFGLHDFITGNKSNEVYRSVDFAKLLILPRSEFMRILKDFPEDKEKFCQLRDDQLYNRGELSNQAMNMKCPICSSREHIDHACPLLHFIPDRERVIKQHQFNTKAVRTKHNRGRRTKQLFQSWNDQSICMEVAEFIQSDLWQEIQKYECTEDAVISPKSSSQSSDDDKPPQPIRTLQQSKVSRSPSLGIAQRQQRQSKINQLMEQKKHTVMGQRSSTRINMPNRQQSQTIIINEAKEFSSAERIQKNPVKPRLPSLTSIHADCDESSPQTPRNQQSVSIKSALKQPQPDKIKSVKVKFQKAFQFITRLKAISHVTRAKQQSPVETQVPEDEQKQHQQHLVDVKRRLMRKSVQLNSHEAKALDLLVIQLNMKLSDKLQAVDDFECQHEFKNYLTHNNLNSLVFTFSPLYSTELSKYLAYFMYPTQYLKRYKNFEPIPLSTSNFKPVSLASRINAYKDVLKIRSKARQIILNRKQVAPEHYQQQ